MTEISQEQTDTINLRAGEILKDILRRIDDSEDQDSEVLEIISETYGGMVALSLLGYKVENMASDAQSGAARLADYLEEVEDDTPASD